MYQPLELARFALSEFERGLEGATDKEARRRTAKADGTEMNAISWTIGHIAGHWLSVAAYAKQEERPSRVVRFLGSHADPTPLPLTDALKLLDDAKKSADWLGGAADSLLSSSPAGFLLSRESVGTNVMRVILHSWFHTGEINAVRQMLGHAEIGFIGDVQGHQEWHGGSNGIEHGYRPDELVRFAISEFQRVLEGLADEEAQICTSKPDGSQMNAVTWTIGHIAMHWLFAYALMTRERMPIGERLFFGPGDDPTPPSLGDMRTMFADATARTEGWLPDVDDDLLSSKRDFGPLADETLGTQLMRAVLHTWFHTGEVNAVRQMLGHAEIPFVGRLIGNLEWRSE